MPHYPSTIEFVASEKTEVMRLKRSLVSILGYLFTALFALFVTLIMIYFFGSMRIPGDIPILRSLSMYWLLLAPVGVLLEAARQYHDDLYIFEQERITREGGRLSLQMNVPSIQYADIRAIAVVQSIWGRIFHYGDVELNTAAQDLDEVSIEGIRYPDELANLVDNIRRHRRNLLLQEGQLLLPEETE